MVEREPSEIDSVTIEPTYCHRCGTELGTEEWEGREVPWCPECDVVFSQLPSTGVHVVVHDDEEVLLLDEPVPQHEGLWSLPGGFTKYDEGPKESLLRELAEETGLAADPADLEFLTILHVELPDRGLYLITYRVDREAVSGELTPEAEGFEASFVPVETVRNSPDRIRESDVDRIEQALAAREE
ncbi:NUDIX hydrolase [Haloarchaeobius amylolyticus]|uniref:NUDIX hydrolase n=1 Tax=Haloarchaeobius amylolyticus TaxID=1198296 RepID=UPI00226F0302|nr:NUDIX domain-containing protein [Haloarchaeobius amylolyticus]